VPSNSIESIPSNYYNVSVSGDLVSKGLEMNKNIEAEMKKAYEQGKNEGLDSVKVTLAAVAAQVYDNVHEQISTFQSQHIEHSNKLVCASSILSFVHVDFVISLFELYVYRLKKSVQVYLHHHL
jgi:hypothetical protein